MYEKTSIGYCEAITPQNDTTDEICSIYHTVP